MVKKIVVELLDDYDGKSDADETVVFALDGISYEIDLSLINAGRLRGVFEQWTPHARKVGRVPTIRSAVRPTSKRQDTAAIREWARANGHPMSSRGRLHGDLVKAYEAANV
ncbi:Lsr2 family protein [Nocardia sp. BMG111209]|uniref:histone-like nucleoid-structuring protein Lsr2 n=1 Tax=Nocardia sp. BMG111209 TaxID=1160137 RepID=UPI0003820339|nr:Lsr2 family protein [Nocardia sp. BMG111209]